MEHTNEILKKILRDEYSDYNRNFCHYDDEYRMLEKAFEKGKELISFDIGPDEDLTGKVAVIGPGVTGSHLAHTIKTLAMNHPGLTCIVTGEAEQLPQRPDVHELIAFQRNIREEIDLTPKLKEAEYFSTKRTNHERQPSRFSKGRKRK